MKRLVVLLCVLLITFAAYDAIERSRLHLKIAKLERGLSAREEMREFSEYIHGVKTGLRFKKNQVKLATSNSQDQDALKPAH